MHHKIDVIRWVLVIPAAFAGWYVALFMGIFLYPVADLFCPPELLISGVCTATWYKPVIDGLVVFGASLSAVLAIFFSFMIAPSKKVLVAKAILLGGVGMALYAAIITSAWFAFIGAITCGLITVVIMHQKDRATNDAQLNSNVMHLNK